MSFKFRFILFLLFLCLLGLTPGTAVQGAYAQSEEPLKVRVDVETVTVDVIALDKNGDPVRNLKAGDFQLYEDGKEQEILSLDEVNAQSGSSALGVPLLGGGQQLRGKTVFIIFDDSSISAEYIKTVRDTAERFVREHMRPQDLFAVAQYDMSMKIIQNFTSDREQVLAAIQRPASSAAGSAIYFENMLRALDAISLAMAPIKGQKSVLIYSQSGFSMGYSTATLGNTYAKTLQTAKKSNVVFYTISPGYLGGPGGGMGTPIGMSGPAGGPMRGAPGGGGRMDAITNLGPAVTLRSLATESGGYSIFNSNNLDAELNSFDRKISNYYVLGFQSNNPKHDGSFRKLEIKVRTKGVTLKHKPGYQDRHPVDVLASSKQERALLTALASPATATQLPVAFRPAYFYDSPQSARVFLTAKIQTEKIVLRKKGGQIGTDLNVMGVAYAEDGSVAARFSETLPISFEKENEAEFRKTSLPYRNYFRLRPGKYRLKLAASDESNNLGATEQPLEIPAAPEQGFSVSSLVLAEGMSELPDLIKNLQARLLDQNDPLIYSKMQIEPSVENRFPVRSTVSTLFRIYNWPNRPEAWDPLATVKLIENGREKFAMAPIHLKDRMSVASPTEAVVSLPLAFQAVPAGKYRLLIEIAGSGSVQTATLQADLEFVQKDPGR
ncbi:MAG TPA: VWA domain-containing protein [Acidobacteriota bacterium]|nr:VWA domain-containing protein [Acidobacteriota bacterium]